MKRMNRARKGFRYLPRFIYCSFSTGSTQPDYRSQLRCNKILPAVLFSCPKQIQPRQWQLQQTRCLLNLQQDVLCSFKPRPCLPHTNKHTHALTHTHTQPYVTYYRPAALLYVLSSAVILFLFSK